MNPVINEICKIQKTIADIVNQIINENIDKSPDFINTGYSEERKYQVKIAEILQKAHFDLDKLKNIIEPPCGCLCHSRDDCSCPCHQKIK